MKTKLILAALSSFFILGTSVLRAENLGERLEKAGLGAIIGTWVDSDTNGEGVTVTYAWRVKNHVLGLHVVTPERTSEAIIGVNPKTDEVEHISFTDDGGAGRGVWKAVDGLPTLVMKTMDAEGEERSIKVSHKIVDDKLVVGMTNPETGETGEYPLVRKAE